MSRHRYFVLILAILAVVAAAGCTKSIVNEEPDLKTLGEAVDNSKLHWYRLSLSGNSDGAMIIVDTTISLNVSYKGQTAIKYDMDTTRDAGTTQEMLAIVYLNWGGDQLGGHVTLKENQRTVWDEELEPVSANYGSINLFDWDRSPNMPLMKAGTETITVSAGTYDCTKYTYKNSNGHISTIWVSPKVPMIIKATEFDGNDTAQMQLIGWG